MQPASRAALAAAQDKLEDRAGDASTEDRARLGEDPRETIDPSVHLPIGERLAVRPDQRDRLRGGPDLGRDQLRQRRRRELALLAGPRREGRGSTGVAWATFRSAPPPLGRGFRS